MEPSGIVGPPDAPPAGAGSAEAGAAAAGETVISPVQLPPAETSTGAPSTVTEPSTDQDRILPDPKRQHVDPAFCKAADLHRGRELQQPHDLSGACPFRIDDHRNAQLLPEDLTFIQIDRIPHPGDGPAFCFFGDKAAKQIDFIAFGYGDQNIRMLDIGILQRRIAGAVSFDPHHIILAGRLFDRLGPDIDDRNTVVFCGELPDKIFSDLPASDYDNLHASVILCCFFVTVQNHAEYE